MGSNTVEELLKRAWHELLSLGRRRYLLDAVLAELERVTRGKPFEVFNDATWLMLLDTRDMFIIELASWTKSVYGKRGLLRQLKTHHCRAFRRRPSDGDKYPHLRSRNDESYTAAFNALFPEIGSKGFPDHRAFDALATRFEGETKPLRDARHNNLAHPYEGDRRRGEPKRLSVEEMHEAHTACTDLVQKLSLVSSGASLAFGPAGIFSAHLESVAEEVTDNLLVGSVLRREHVFEGKRDEYYEDRHRRHEARTANDGALFNSIWPEERA